AEEVARLAGIAPERVVVVPLGGPAPSPPPAPGDAAEAMEVLGRFGVVPGRYILHVGVLERRKNLGMLARAFARWRSPADGGSMRDAATDSTGAESKSDFKLVLVGQPGPRPDLDDSGALRQLIAELGLESSVVLTGHVTSVERDAFYAHAAAVAIPSTFEGFGLPVLEAFAARAPVVAARATALPEVAGDAALLFDPANPAELATCLARVTSDTALGASLVERGLARVAQFTWERTAAETLRVFERAADPTAARAGPHT
ncbi:MAG TPA: glycosyltransferase, partial [Ktedonobacterales bacterium]